MWVNILLQIDSANWFKVQFEWQQQAGGESFLTRLCSSLQAEEEKCGNSFCCACVFAGGPRFTP